MTAPCCQRQVRNPVQSQPNYPSSESCQYLSSVQVDPAPLVYFLFLTAIIFPDLKQSSNSGHTWPSPDRFTLSLTSSAETKIEFQSKKGSTTNHKPPMPLDLKAEHLSETTIFRRHS